MLTGEHDQTALSRCFVGRKQLCACSVTIDRGLHQPRWDQGHNRHWCWRGFQQRCAGNQGIPATSGKLWLYLPASCCFQKFGHCALSAPKFHNQTENLLCSPVCETSSPCDHMHCSWSRSLLYTGQRLAASSWTLQLMSQECRTNLCCCWVQLGGYNQQVGQSINDGVSKTKEYLPNQVLLQICCATSSPMP